MVHRTHGRHVLGWLLTGWLCSVLKTAAPEGVCVQQLVECHMLSSTEESELLCSLSFAPGDAWIPLLYRSTLLHAMQPGCMLSADVPSLISVPTSMPIGGSGF